MQKCCSFKAGCGQFVYWWFEPCLHSCLQVKKLFSHEGQQLKVHERLLSGSTAGVIAQTTIYPMEVGVAGGWVGGREGGRVGDVCTPSYGLMGLRNVM